MVTPHPHDLQASLGRAIKAERERLGVTQEELAWRADMHRTYLADIERGVRNVTLRSVTNLARALEVSVAQLLGTPKGKARVAPPRRVPGEILLVEDEPADVELTVRALERAQVANPIKIVRDGRQALDYLECAGRYARRRPIAPELVLLDLHLPNLSGLEVLRRIRSRPATRSIRVVVLTVSRDDKTIIECARLGTKHYIIKPVNFQSLTEVAPLLNLSWALVGSSRPAPQPI